MLDYLLMAKFIFGRVIILTFYSTILWQASASGGMLVKNIASGGDIYFQPHSITALSLSGTDQNATFGGNLIVPHKIMHSGDTDNYHAFGTDTQSFVTGNSTRMSIANSLVRFNQEGVNQDFQIFGENVDNLFYVDASADKIGIGTNTPSSRLSVNSGTSDWPGYFKSTDNKAGIIIADDDTTGYFGVESSKAFMGLQAGIHANNLNIDSSGRVGIGIVSPSNLLHINQSGNTIPLLVQTDNHVGVAVKGGNSHDRYVSFQQTNGSVGAKVGWDHSSQVLKLNAVDTFGSSHLVVSTGGNIGINKVNPNYKLHILESTTNAGALFIEDGTSWLRFVPSLGGGGFNPIATAGDIGIIFSTDNDSSTDTSGGLIIAPHSNTAGGIKIREDGKVGLGTDVPRSVLHISHATAPTFRLSRTGTGQVWVQSIDSSGRFQLAESASEGGTQYTRLQVDDTGEITFNGAYTFPTADGSNGQVLQTDGSGNLTFAAAGGGTITGVSNMADNRILTAQGATTINAETNLTFGTAGNQLILRGSTAAPGIFRIDDYETGSTSSGKYGEFKHDSGTSSLIARNGSSNGVVNFKGYNGSSFTTYGGFDASGNFEIGTTDIIDASRNMSNIGTISSGAITSTGADFTGQVVIDADNISSGALRIRRPKFTSYSISHCI